MKTAIYPGSFDPITNGHLDIIRRSAAMFDKVTVTVMVNPRKQGGLFTPLERMDFIKRCVADMPNVEVEYSDGLLAQYAKEKNATAVIKGLRAVSDFEDEFQQALINKKLNPDVETVFLISALENMYLSSSAVKQIFEFGGDASEFLPEQVCGEIKDRLLRKHK